MENSQKKKFRVIEDAELKAINLDEDGGMTVIADVKKERPMTDDETAQLDNPPKPPKKHGVTFTES